MKRHIYFILFNSVNCNDNCSKYATIFFNLQNIISLINLSFKIKINFSWKSANIKTKISTFNA